MLIKPVYFGSFHFNYMDHVFAHDINIPFVCSALQFPVLYRLFGDRSFPLTCFTNDSKPLDLGLRKLTKKWYPNVYNNLNSTKLDSENTATLRVFIFQTSLGYSGWEMAGILRPNACRQAGCARTGSGSGVHTNTAERRPAQTLQVPRRDIHARG